MIRPKRGASAIRLPRRPKRRSAGPSSSRPAWGRPKPRPMAAFVRGFRKRIARCSAARSNGSSEGSACDEKPAGLRAGRVKSGRRKNPLGGGFVRRSGCVGCQGPPHSRVRQRSRWTCARHRRERGRARWPPCGCRLSKGAVDLFAGRSERRAILDTTGGSVRCGRGASVRPHRNVKVAAPCDPVYTSTKVLDEAEGPDAARGTQP